MTRVFLVFAVLAVFAVACTPAAGVDIGTPAPPLSISEWVKGEPVDLRKVIGKKVVVVEFWATWCPPCKATIPRLTELQRKHRDDLTIIGVTVLDDRGNTRREVKRFVKKQGASMDYTVAIDKGDATMSTYVGDTSVVGIPYAFVVAKDGTVAWQGSPLEPALGDVLDQLVSGQYDIEAAKVEAEVNRRWESLAFSLQIGQWSVVWDGLIGILKLDAANETAMDILTQVYVNETRDTRAFRAWAGSHLAANRDNATAMYRLANSLCSITDMATRTPDLALEAARAAYKASDQRDAAAIAAYALALYQIGALDRAIALQRDAVALVAKPDQRAAQGILDYYNECKRLQSASQ